MAEVSFGYSNEENPTMWQGIGTNGLPIGPVRGELVGIVAKGEEHYLISKRTLAYKDEGLGGYDVKPLFVEVNSDGSYCAYLDQQADYESQRMNAILNSEYAKDRFEKGYPVAEIVEAHNPSNIIYLGLANVEHEIVTISIRHDVFERKKEELKHCFGSFIDHQRQIEDLRQQLDELRRGEPQAPNGGFHVPRL